MRSGQRWWWGGRLLPYTLRWNHGGLFGTIGPSSLLRSMRGGVHLWETFMGMGLTKGAVFALRNAVPPPERFDFALTADRFGRSYPRRLLGGMPYDSVFVSSNGFMIFRQTNDVEGVSSGCCVGGVIPSVDGLEGIVSAYWADLNPQAAAQAFTGEPKSDMRGQSPFISLSRLHSAEKRYSFAGRSSRHSLRG